MKCIVAGGRYIDSFFQVHLAIAESGWHNEITEVFCGMAGGADALGRKWAEKYKIPVRPFKADWNKYGRAAGPIRNEEMAQEAHGLILIWDNQSKGSKNMLKNAELYRLKICQHFVEKFSEE